MGHIVWHTIYSCMYLCIRGNNGTTVIVRQKWQRIETDVGLELNNDDIALA